MELEGASGNGENTQTIEITEPVVSLNVLPSRERAISVSDETLEDQSKVPITIKLTDQDGGAMVFKIRMGTPLRKIMNAFADRKGVESRILRFSYDGERVDPHHTPKMLEMQQMDEIQVFLPAHGGNAA